MSVFTSSQKDLIILTERFVLRPLRKGDIAILFEKTSRNSELAKYLKWDPPKTLEEAQKLFLPKKKDMIRWGIFWKNQFVGCVSLLNIIRSLGSREINAAEMGYWILPEFCGQGCATEAAKYMIRFGFQVLKLHKIMASCTVENEPSNRVLEKLGFRFVGTRKDHYFKYNRWWDMKLYEMTKNELID
ncbi:GNAT family N-acetyltransferase [Candidatus Gracilibacteria bacterium]|nr:GNAT family N-acetyltransferase [Candidatus Gracilibacteria bacterium]